MPIKITALTESQENQSPEERFASMEVNGKLRKMGVTIQQYVVDKMKGLKAPVPMPAAELCYSKETKQRL